MKNEKNEGGGWEKIRKIVSDWEDRCQQQKESGQILEVVGGEDMVEERRW